MEDARRQEKLTFLEEDIKVLKEMKQKYAKAQDYMTASYIRDLEFILASRWREEFAESVLDKIKIN